jgi:hypothetical protein
MNTADGRCLNLESFLSKETLKPIQMKPLRQYFAKMDPPVDGRWVAFFIDIIYDKLSIEDTFGDSFTSSSKPKDLPGWLQFTSEVSVFPNTFPFEDCSSNKCSGNLV